MLRLELQRRAPPLAKIQPGCMSSARHSAHGTMLRPATARTSLTALLSALFRAASRTKGTVSHRNISSSRTAARSIASRKTGTTHRVPYRPLTPQAGFHWTRIRADEEFGFFITNDLWQQPLEPSGRDPIPLHQAVAPGRCTERCVHPANRFRFALAGCEIKLQMICTIAPADWPALERPCPPIARRLGCQCTVCTKSSAGMRRQPIDAPFRFSSPIGRPRAWTGCLSVAGPRRARVRLPYNGLSSGRWPLTPKRGGTKA